MLKELPIYRQAGFSLIELMIGITIIMVLVSLAFPSYKVWIQNTKIRNAAESIQNGVQLARAEAVKRNTSVQFDFRGTNSAWTVCVRPVVPGSCPNPDNATTIQSRAISEGSSTDITIASTDALPLVFNGFGALISPAPAAADGFLRMTVDINSSALSATLSRDLQVIIGVGGNVRMCDPSTTLSVSDPRKCP